MTTKPLEAEDIDLPSTSFRDTIYNELLKSFRFMGGTYPPDLHDRIRDEFDYALATFIMDVSQGSVSKASRIFGMSKNAVWHITRRFDIDHNLYKQAYGKGAYGKGYSDSKKRKGR